jgi:hypothetical protein
MVYRLPAKKTASSSGTNSTFTSPTAPVTAKHKLAYLAN